MKRKRSTGKPARPRAYRTETDLPDRVMVAIAALVPASHAVEGHAERMAAHAERVTREGVPCCGPAVTLCFACGRTESRKVSVHGAPGERWHSRPICGNPNNVETYCPECFARWGWGVDDPVVCDDEQGA